MTIPSTSALYTTTSAALRNGNGNGGKHNSPLLISGKEIFSRTNRSRGVGPRAGIGAQLVCDEARATNLSVAQAAVITHATIQSIYEALHLAPAARAQVAAGELSLAEAIEGNGLLAAWIAATPAQKAALGVARGVTEIWDEAIQPLI